MALDFLRILGCAVVVLRLGTPGDALASPCTGASPGDPFGTIPEEIGVPVHPAFQEIPDPTRREIQWDLIWAGRYSGEVDGIFGPLTVGAIKRFQQTMGDLPTGWLTEEQETELLRLAGRRERSVGFAPTIDEATGFMIPLPLSLVHIRSATEYGSLYRSKDGRLEVRTMRIRDGRSLCDIYREETSRNGRSITYSLTREGSFVVMWSEAARTTFLQAFEGEAFAGDPEIRAISVSFPGRQSAELHPIVVAIWNSFRPFEQLAVDSPLDQPNDSTGAVPPPLTPQEVFERSSPSVYLVVVKTPPTESEGAGGGRASAVAVTESLALTNCHAVSKAEHITLSRETIAMSGIVKFADEDKDQCIIESSNRLQPVQAIRRYSDLAVGEPVFAIGNPFGVRTFSDGIISALHDSLWGTKYVQITAPMSQGSSGGAVVDAHGNLVAITTKYIEGAQSMNFAIAAEEFCSEIEESCRIVSLRSGGNQGGGHERSGHNVAVD